MVSHRGIGRRFRGDQVCGLGLVRTVSLSDLVFGRRSMTVVEKEGSRAIVNKGGKSVQRNEGFRSNDVQIANCANERVNRRDLPTLITTLVHDALAQGLELLGDALVDKSSRNEELDRVKEERDGFLE